MSQTIRAGLVVVTIICVIAPGCGDSTPTGPRPAAALQIAANPSPIAPTVCPPSNCGSVLNQLEALTTITVRETAGVGGRISSVGLLLRRDGDNLVLATGTYTPPSVLRFESRGAATFPVGVHFERDQSTGPATLTLTVQASDDNGNNVSVTLAVPVSRV